MTDDIHSCGFHCTRPACVEARAREWEEQRRRIAELEAEHDAIMRKWSIETDESLTECVERNIDGWKQRCWRSEAELTDQILTLRSENAALKADAERYRWLRIHYEWFVQSAWEIYQAGHAEGVEEAARRCAEIAGEAIDAEIAQWRITKEYPEAFK